MAVKETNVGLAVPPISKIIFYKKADRQTFCYFYISTFEECESDGTSNETHVPSGKGKALECFIISKNYLTNHALCAQYILETQSTMK